MGWVLGAALAVGLLAGAVVVVGALLPVEHVARVRIWIDQPPLEVFGAIRDVTGAREWRTGIKSVEVLSSPGEPLRWRETGSFGTVTFLREEAQPPLRLVYRIDDPSLPFAGRWIYEVEAEREATRLSITEEGQVRNPVFRFVSRFIFGHHRTLEQYARDLARHFDEDPAEPERVR